MIDSFIPIIYEQVTAITVGKKIPDSCLYTANKNYFKT